MTNEDNPVKVDSDRVLDTINPISWLNTAKKIDKWDPDLLLTRYWMPFFAPSLGYVSRRRGKQCIAISVIDNIIPHERRLFDKPLTESFIKSNDGFVALTNSVKQDLLNIAPNARCVVSPHPLYNHFGEKIDKISARKRLDIGLDKRTILFFGLIREYKGLDLLIEAFSNLDDSYQLIIAGEPYGSFDKYESMIRNSPNGRNIHSFTRYINDEEVPTFFSASDVCVLPYRSATQSGVSAISYHFEVPMIVTATGGLKEDIGDRGTGLITDPAPQSIALAIKDFFESGRENTFIANIRSEKDRLSWSNFCSDLLSLYLELKK